jgi:hypothetical protein
MFASQELPSLSGLDRERGHFVKRLGHDWELQTQTRQFHFFFLFLFFFCYGAGN